MNSQVISASSQVIVEDSVTVYMFGGLFASFFFEILFLIVFRFVLFPFSTFAPVILLWLWRWLRSRKDELRLDSLYSKALRGEVAH